jgi:putative membrane protein
MFLWTNNTIRKRFNNTKEQAKTTQLLAKNQGLYNGFLAIGLIWGLTYTNLIVSKEILTFFLSCIFIAGVYGGITVKKSIFFIQGIPALLGLMLIFFKH